MPRPSLWWLAYLALVPLLVLARSAPTQREAAIRGWWWGAGYVLGMYHWLLPNLHVFLLGIAALLGLLWLAIGALARYLLRDPLTGARTAAALTALPAAVVLAELVTSWDRLGGPWALLGSSQWNVAPVRSLAALGGPWLISAFIMLVNVAVLIAVVGGPRQKWYAGGAAATALAGVLGWVAVIPDPAGSCTLRVALVQPGIVHDPAARFAAGETLTNRLSGPLDLVIWAESSVGYDLDSRPDLRERLVALARRTGAPVLVNVDARRGSGRGSGPGNGPGNGPGGGPNPGAGGIYKSSILLDPSGEQLARYDKRRLVPFGEYLPMRPLLGWITSLSEAAGEDRRRGERSVLMPVGGVEIGPLVSFEASFPDMSRELARLGADVLVFQIATSTFQDSWGPWRNAATSALRAVETGRPVVHATLTGVSTAYDATGRRLGQVMGTRFGGVQVFEVPLGSRSTPYARLGNWLPALAAVYLPTLGLLALAAKRRVRASAGSTRMLGP